MAQNTTPIFLGVPQASWAALAASAVTETDGTGANTKTIFTADATDGGKIETVFVKVTATCPNATVIRFWINNGSSAGTAANNSLIHEETLAITTVTAAAATTPVVWPANLVLPAGYKLLAASASSIGGVQVSAIGGSY